MAVLNMKAQELGFLIAKRSLNYTTGKSGLNRSLMKEVHFILQYQKMPVLMEIKLNSVLLIDDDEITNFLQKHVLLRTGFVSNIQIAESVREGIELIKEIEG